MRISSSNFNRFWYRHPVANPVSSVLLSVYALFVILFTAVHGSESLQSVLALPVSAVLGAEISVPTLDGRVNIKIPAGTQSGQKLRVRGRGLPVRGGTRGDLMVITQIAVPAKASDAERKLWEQLARESRFNPRS